MTLSEKSIPHFLCDTWWYGLTQRFPEDSFRDLARLRHEQGFTAVQLVVGIPPEIGPKNPNAASIVGPAWHLENGEFNAAYLNYARKKVEFLNSEGLTAVIYGAWGHQIEWLGLEKMQNWWREIVKTMDDLNVIYCLTGESDIFIGDEKKLLPDKTTDALSATRIAPFLPTRLVYLGKRLVNMISGPASKNNRHQQWSEVLKTVYSLTEKPIIVHVLPNTTSEQSVNNNDLLSAVTVQTGHDAGSRNLLWQLPRRYSGENKKFINLEPWYEGILENFGTDDQIYAYWASMMGGAHAYCYGAHGLWNAGDGKFLSHWGKQTFAEAVNLQTPQLIGLSHRLFVGSGFIDYPQVRVEEKNGELIQITRSSAKGQSISYLPEVSLAESSPQGKMFLPTRGKFTNKMPNNGQLVVIS